VERARVRAVLTIAVTAVKCACSHCQASYLPSAPHSGKEEMMISRENSYQQGNILFAPLIIIHN
jgi:hypothetical protein